MKTAHKKYARQVAVTVVALTMVNVVASQFFLRFDLTQDKRYTLSQTSLNIIKEAKEPLYVDVFLKGDFPAEFKRLQNETQDLLEEFKAYNGNVVFRFVNPLEESDDMAETKRELIYTVYKLNNQIQSAKEEAEIKQSIAGVSNLNEALGNSFVGNGMTPISVTLDDKGKQTQETVFPWAIATYGERSVKIPLLKNMMGASTQDKVVSSVQHLEYAFANAFNTVTKSKEKKVAIIKGNGELRDLFIADFVKSVKENYGIGTFTLDSVSKQPNETLKYLKRYDLAVIAKPIEKFSEAEKQVIDQYIIGGGKTLWLLDQVNMEMDSLYNESGSTLAFPNDLNLEDLFFKYGVRISPKLVKDIMATPIALATGEQGSATQYTQYPWFYSPMIYPSSKNPIVSNLDGLKFEFANGIELLNNDVKKTVLLQSSAYSKIVGTPVEVRLDMVQERPEQSEFKDTGNIPVAVLLEGDFHSMYQNRILSFPDKSFLDIGKDNKMIVVSDGDLIRNQFDKNFQPLELGFDKWTNKLYANKEFLMNCVNYLLDDNGLINIRSKEVTLPLLDKEKVYDGYATSQMITVGLPIAILAVFGLAFTFVRKRQYGK